LLAVSLPSDAAYSGTQDRRPDSHSGKDRSPRPGIAAHDITRH